MPVRSWFPFALLLVLAAPTAAPAAAASEALHPLIRLAGWESGCGRDAPDSCHPIFRDRLVEVFRNGRATAISSVVTDGAAPASHVADGVIPPEALAALSAAITEAQLGESGGSCNPYPESSSFPNAASFDLVWFGRTGRRTLLTLDRVAPPCPAALSDVFTQLLQITDVGIVPGS